MTPLTPLRTIPMSQPTNNTIKRPFHDTVYDSRKKQRKNTPCSSSTPTSSPPRFKVPALPVRRALTPSTSTVAASSSPPRLSSPSSRGGREEGDMESVTVYPNSPLIFGRHRHQPTSNSPGSSSSSIYLRSAVPTHLHHLVTDLDSPSTIIYLSRYASHASRTHALVEYDEEKDGLRVLVIGQNGLKIGGKRVLAGQRVEVMRKERVILDFYGTKVGVLFPPLTERVPEEILRAQLFTPDLSSPVQERLSLPPSSPPMEASSDNDVDMDGDETKRAVSPLPRALSPLFSRSSSPLSVPSDEEEDAEMSEQDVSEPMAEEAEVEVEGEGEDDESRDLTPPPKSPAREKSIKRELLESVNEPSYDPLPIGVDLPALLASTVVFSGSSKLSLPDLVKHMLDSQPSLREKGEEGKWQNWASGVLENNPMFGKVQRHGKDSSGHPLLPHYFYNPANDPDTSRAAELGGLVRPLRTVQRAGGKAIDWRPVGSGRRRY